MKRKNTTINLLIMENAILNIVSEKFNLEDLKKEAIKLTEEYFESELNQYKSKFGKLPIIQFERFEIILENELGVNGLRTFIGIYKSNENFVKGLERIGDLIMIYDFDGNYIDEFGDFSFPN